MTRSSQTGNIRIPEFKDHKEGLHPMLDICEKENVELSRWVNTEYAIQTHLQFRKNCMSSGESSKPVCGVVAKIAY